MEAHEKFMSEEPPNDVHLKNILDPAQTHVAIGIAINAERFRFVEVFMTRYIKLNEKPLLSTNFEIVGKVESNPLTIFVLFFYNLKKSPFQFDI